MIMSPDNSALKSQSKEGSPSSGDRKTSMVRRQEQVINCPRCNSPNTKFCYYNNYSRSQPRHYCKSCRRYWTKGGAIRNVPIGGGCRKNKKIKSSSSKDYSSATSSSDISGFNFFQGFSPAMDFPRINSSTTSSIFNHNSSLGGTSTIGSSPCFNLEHSGSCSAGHSMGFNFSLSNSLQKQGNITGGVSGMGSGNDTSNLASSIESLSSINQDLHWKLQQQRLTHMLFDGENQIDSNIQRPHPILFQNLEISKTEAAFRNTSRKVNNGSGNLATEWFFDNSFTSLNPTPTNSSTGNANENSNSWNEIQGWSNLNDQYSTLLP